MRPATLLVTFVLLAACSSHKTADEASHQIAQPLCQRMSECENSLFVQTFTDVPTCIDKLETHGASGRESCTDDQLNQCTSDIGIADCTTIQKITILGDKSAMPASCNGC
jgi:hypothetical protein